MTVHPPIDARQGRLSALLLGQIRTAPWGTGKWSAMGE